MTPCVCCVLFHAVTNALTCWGWNQYGALGLNPAEYTYIAAPRSNFTLLEGVAKVTLGNFFGCALMLVSGVVKCWGWNAVGQLGVNLVGGFRFTPADVLGLANVTSVAAGFAHACAVSDGVAYCWGDNTYGQLGVGTLVNSAVPAVVTGIPSGVRVLDVGTGYEHTCVLLSTTAVRCFGGNRYNQVCVALPSVRSVPAVADDCAV